MKGKLVIAAVLALLMSVLALPAYASNGIVVSIPVTIDEGGIALIAPAAGSPTPESLSLELEDKAAASFRIPVDSPGNYSYAISVKDDGYEDVMEVAQRWREPIRAARMRGLSDSEIVGVLTERFGSARSVATIRGWVGGSRIAPQSEEDIRGIFSAFHIYIKDEDVSAIARAASRIRGQHQRTGMMTAGALVRKFIEDVGTYGLDDALAGFDERHESGNVELLTVSAVGERMSVAEDRVEIL